MPSKTKTSFYRRLLVAYLIDRGIDTVPKIMENTGMPRRTAQDTLEALKDLDLKITHMGATKSGYYRVEDWGPINKQWLYDNHDNIRQVLGYSMQCT